MNQLQKLINNDQDFEWYPTTDEILSCIRDDIYNFHKLEEYRYRYSRRSMGIDFDDNSFRDNEPSILSLDSFLDIGAGDGRVFDRITREINRKKVRIGKRYGIEKARLQGDNLIKNDVALIGRDFFETALIDRSFTCVFSNPPYSEYKKWCIKIAKEVNATLIYLVIPQRWKVDSDLQQLFSSVGKVTTIGSFDFTEGERAARAKVDVVKIMVNDKNDTFRSWVENNIGTFERNEEVNLDIEDDMNAPDKWYQLKEHNDNTVAVMVENYNEDMHNLVTTFQSLGSIDWGIISQLGVSKDDVLSKIKSDIANLKNRYWRLVINNLDEITSRLTHKMRQEILSEITWFNELDFNENNIRTIALWVIENFNKYTRQQMLDVYDKITDFNNVRAYKSNDKWIEDSWRYTNKVPTKYSLDYRIVVSIGYQLFDSSYNNNAKYGNPIEDLAIVARSLGFDNWGIYGASYPHKFNYSEKCYCYKKEHKDKEDVLFEYKIYKNNNVHFKLDKDFLRVLNVEVGKERGWIKNPADLQSEFDMNPEDAMKFFTNSGLKTISTNDLLMLTDGS
jgi:hypothetical protein